MHSPAHLELQQPDNLFCYTPNSTLFCCVWHQEFCLSWGLAHSPICSQGDWGDPRRGIWHQHPEGEAHSPARPLLVWLFHALGNEFDWPLQTVQGKSQQETYPWWLPLKLSRLMVRIQVIRQTPRKIKMNISEQKGIKH